MGRAYAADTRVLTLFAVRDLDEECNAQVIGALVVCVLRRAYGL